MNKHRANGLERFQSRVFPPIFDHCKSIKQIRLCPYDRKELLEWIERCLRRFSTVQKVTVVINSALTRSPNPVRPRLGLISAVLDLELHLGIRPLLSRVPTGHHESWYLKALKGHTLKWKES
jgi:hypothetical protein